MNALWHAIQEDQLFWLGLSIGLTIGVAVMNGLHRLNCWMDNRR